MSDVNDIKELQEEVLNGICGVSGCDKKTEYMLDKFHPPIYCRHHNDDGSDTHSGTYDNIDVYNNRWSCCGNGWKLSHCRKNQEKFEEIFSQIPITDYHREKLQEIEAIHEINEENRRRIEAQYSSGHDEYYDR